MFRKKPASPNLPPEWLIVGLGNPGAEYARTRHNAGFDTIDQIAECEKVKLNTFKFNSAFSLCDLAGHSVALAKPLTFMNLSGQAVKPLLKHFNLEIERLIVVTDELDLAPGKVRLRASGGAAGHNGHRSLIQALGTQDYIRIKIGVGKVPKDATVDHVLGRFHPDERVEIDRAINDAIRIIEIIVKDGISKALANQPS